MKAGEIWHHVRNIKNRVQIVSIEKERIRYQYEEDIGKDLTMTLSRDFFTRCFQKSYDGGLDESW